MEILNVPSADAYAESMAPHRLLLNSQNEDLQPVADDPARFAYRAGNELLQHPLTLQSAKSISNPFNFFYFEIEVLRPGKWVLMGYSAQGVRTQAIPGKTTLWGFNLGVLVKGDTLSLYLRRTKSFEKRVPNLSRVGLGVSILKATAFLTVDGRIETEVNIQRLIASFPSLTMTPGAEVRVHFTNTLFDPVAHAHAIVAGLRSSQAGAELALFDEDGALLPLVKKKNKINKRKTADMVSEYLKLRGFARTLQLFKQSELFPHSKPRRDKDKKPKTKGGLKSKAFAALREEVIARDNWEFFLAEPLIREDMSDHLRANVVARALAKRYAEAGSEEARLALIDQFARDFAGLKAEEITGTSTTLEGVFCALMCGEEDFGGLLGAEHKHELLETFFEQANPKRCELLNMVRYLDALLQTNAQLNGFEAGHSMDNFRF